MKRYFSKSAVETKAIAAKLAKGKSLGVIALSGELGSGKTTFVQGFAKGLGIKEKIISPTFVLMRHHQIPKTEKVLFHIDLYRLEKDKEFNDLGITEILNNPNQVIIEWAEKLKKLPKGAIKISIKKAGLSRRIIIIHNS